MDITFIEELAKLLNRSSVQEIAVSYGDDSVKLRRGYAPSEFAPELSEHGESSAPDGREESEQEIPGRRITSGMVGIFRAVEPVAVGSVVQEGQLIGLIESMRLMNEITSPASGTVDQMLVEDGSPVEYGQTLILLNQSEKGK